MVAPELTNSDPLINRTIEGYEFIKRLGEGTYGMVYLARHPRIKERLVAVKYIKLDNAQEAEYVEQEVDILARLQHPNVVDIYDTYRFDNYQLIVMELVRGGSLQESLHRINGLLDLRTVIECIEQLAFGLGYVHDQNILHLDLKPANVLLDPVGEGQSARYVLTDFGIAQIVKPDVAKSVAIVGGTPMYMSPEHFGFGDNKPDRRSDIYSLGVILYELVVGIVPFQSDKLLDLLNQHAYGAVPLPSASIPNIPPMLDNIVLKAMSKVPNERFQTATAMGSALRELRMGPMMDLKASMGGRVSGDALGVIAQQGADQMEAIDAQHPIRERGNPINLLILKPDGSFENVSFKQQSIIVGRDKNIDLPLDERTVSRRHLQIDCDRHGKLHVTDLDSANGTYLDGVRVNPQEKTAWQVGQFLQIQGFLLQIADEGGKYGAPLLMTTDQVMAVLAKLEKERQKSVVRMTLVPAVVSVEPGKPHYIQVLVTTENAPAGHYELRAKPGPGIEESWYTLPASQYIPADGAHTFDFMVNMPSSGTLGGKTHEIMLQVIAADTSDETVTTFQVLKVRVASFTRFTVALQPSEVSHHRRRRATLIISNTGNQVEDFSLEFEAPDTLKISASEPRVSIDASQEKRIQLKFKAARGVGKLRTRLIYSVNVRAASGLMERANGSYVFKRRESIPAALLLLWLILMFIVVRMTMFGVPLEQQFNEFRTIVELLIRRIRGG